MEDYTVTSDIWENQYGKILFRARPKQMSTVSKKPTDDSRRDESHCALIFSSNAGIIFRPKMGKSRKYTNDSGYVPASMLPMLIHVMDKVLNNTVAHPKMFITEGGRITCDKGLADKISTSIKAPLGKLLFMPRTVLQTEGHDSKRVQGIIWMNDNLTTLGAATLQEFGAIIGMLRTLDATTIKLLMTICAKTDEMDKKLNKMDMKLNRILEKIDGPDEPKKIGNWKPKG